MLSRGQNLTLEVIQVNLSMHINTKQDRFCYLSNLSAILAPARVELLAQKLPLQSAKLQKND